MKRINSLCGVFLWQGDIKKHHTARVSWEVVIKPKREGGLGLKNLAIWNKACCLKLIWLLFFQSGLVWVAWFVEEVLNGSLSNLWTTTPHRRYSWKLDKTKSEEWCLLSFLDWQLVPLWLHKILSQPRRELKLGNFE